MAEEPPTENDNYTAWLKEKGFAPNQARINFLNRLKSIESQDIERKCCGEPWGDVWVYEMIEEDFPRAMLVCEGCGERQVAVREGEHFENDLNLVLEALGAHLMRQEQNNLSE